MKISQVLNPIYVGEFHLDKKHDRNHINISYNSELDNILLTSLKGRVYLFSSDGVIKKIGGSASKGGIKSTISFYTNSMTGSPGKPRFILHLLIRDELMKGKICKVHMITSPNVSSLVNGLTEQKEISIAAFKEMEDLCKKNYFDIMKRYPDWNFQENNIDYPSNYSLEHVRYHEQRLKNK